MNYLLIFALIGVCSAVELLRVKEPVGGQYIVIFKKNISNVEFDSHMDAVAVNSSVLYKYDFPGFQGYAAEMGEVGLAMALKSPHVQTVEENGMVYISDDVKDIPTLACNEQQGATWGLVRTAEEDLVITGSYKYVDETGKGVRSYVIDTGIYLGHNDFEGRAIWGYNAVDSDNSDGNGHGTHVAGTIGAKTYGLAKGCTLIAVKVLNAGGSGSTAGVIAGVNYVANDAISKNKKKAGAKATANMSLGGGKSTSLNAATTACVEAGVVMAVASGNDRGDACSKSPASTPEAITVSASDNRDAMASFSNYGSCVDVFGPGVSITSTWIGSPTSDNTISGTSMASPHVAGVATKLIWENPDFDHEKIKADVLATASAGKLSGVIGSPNLLVYHGCYDK